MFEPKVAILTGAAIGIGYRIAEVLAANGAAILLNDIDRQAAEKAQAALTRSGARCEIVVGDSGNVDTIDEMVGTALDRFGRIDLAVANAGITTFGRFLDYSVSDFQHLVSVNLQGTFFLAQRAARQMIVQGDGGRILLMSSVTGVQYHPDLAAYGMSKAAIRMLAKTLGVELAPHGITVNAIAPGATLTERTLELEGGAYEAVWGNITPTGRPASTDDIAQAAQFFLSPAASQITGQTLIVDGGWTSVSPPPPNAGSGSE